MDRNDLNQVRALRINIQAIQEEISALYFPYTSPNAPKDGGSNPNRGSDPTVSAFHRIEKKRAELDRIQAEYSMKVVEIEDWLKTIEDLEVVAIIRCHYILGKTWKQTAKQVYGYASRETARMRVERFLKK